MIGLCGGRATGPLGAVVGIVTTAAGRVADGRLKRGQVPKGRACPMLMAAVTWLGRWVPPVASPRAVGGSGAEVGGSWRGRDEATATPACGDSCRVPNR